ncbi:sulfatase-like hydrolase/transferase [bacterium]|nr:sulfatase-like hydrolase/transferase [bacterium]
MPKHNNAIDAKHPNILYIMSDQHSARVMGCAGDSAADTPNLDSLAKSGTRFSRAYCPSPVCLPSRMSMLTGLRPHQQECWTNDDILDSGKPTWLHGLGAAGYRPVLFGRMHALGPDQLHGYTDRPIGDHSPNWPGVARRSLGALAKTSGPFKQSIEKSGVGQSSYQLLDADVLDASINFLKDHAKSGDGEPFCLSASFMLPHPPYVASKRDFDAVKDHVQPPAQPLPNNQEHPWIKLWRESKSLDNISAEAIHRARCAYYALVRQLDRAIGQLLTTLDEIGERENTLIIYVSDHGDHLGERGLFWKHTFYEESVKVPLIMSWPAKIEQNRTCKHPIETGGLGNTILTLVGCPPLPSASMPSFDNLLTGKSTPKDQPVFIEYCIDDLPQWTEGYAVQQRAVILGQLKYIFCNGFPDQLFDLKHDPAELNNIAQDPLAQEMLAKLRDLVFADWNPDQIAERIEARKADKQLLKAWAEKTNPAEKCRWDLKAEQNYLD